MRISDWSSDVCSSDLRSDTASVHRSPTRGESPAPLARHQSAHRPDRVRVRLLTSTAFLERFHEVQRHDAGKFSTRYRTAKLTVPELGVSRLGSVPRSEEHTSELQSLMRISYAFFCLKNKNIQQYMT